MTKEFISYGVNKAHVCSDSDLGIWPGPCRIIYRFAEDEARDRRDQCSVLGALSGSGAGCCPLGKLSAEKLYNLLSPLRAPDWPGSALRLPAHHQPLTSDQPHLRTQWGHALSLRVSRISHTRRKSASVIKCSVQFFVRKYQIFSDSCRKI